MLVPTCRRRLVLYTLVAGIDLLGCTADEHSPAQGAPPLQPYADASDADTTADGTAPNGDAETPTRDTGEPGLPEAAAPEDEQPDAGRPDPDAGRPDPDAGRPDPDAERPDPDAGRPDASRPPDNHVPEAGQADGDTPVEPVPGCIGDPGDTPSEVEDLGLVGELVTVCGTTTSMGHADGGTEGDRDFVSFTAAYDGAYRIELTTSSASDTDLALYADEESEPFAESKLKGEGKEVISADLVAGRRYVIGVSGSTGSVPAIWSLKLRHFADSGCLGESGDTPSSALSWGPLLAPTIFCGDANIAGGAAGRRDIDYIEFSPLTNALHTFELSWASGTGTDFNLWLETVADPGVPLGSASQPGVDLLETLTTTSALNPSTTYRVAVEHAAGGAAPWTLRVTQESGACDPTQTPDSDQISLLGLAGDLNYCGRIATAGAADYTGDPDWYAFYTAVAGDYTASVSWTDPASDIDLFIYNSAVGSLGTSASREFGPTTASVTVNLAADAWVYVRITAFAGVPDIDYSLTLSEPVVPAACLGEAGNANTALVDLGVLSGEGTECSTIYYAVPDIMATDIDSFLFSPGITGTFSFGLEMSDPGSDYDLYLQDWEGTLLASSLNGSSTPETITYDLMQGDSYTLIVVGYTGPAAAYTLSYESQ